MKDLINPNSQQKGGRMGSCALDFMDFFDYGLFKILK
jgi:hypothetical protein